MTPGSRLDGYAKIPVIFGFFGKTWSILEPFREDFLPNRAQSDPTNLGSGPRQMESGPRQMEPGRNLGMDFGFFFLQLRTLDFEGSKKAPETSFLDS